MAGKAKMTPQEFRDTINRYLLVYLPDTKKWMRGLDEATKAAWASRFEHVEIRDLKAAIEDVVSGRTEIPAYHRERTPQILLVAAKRFAYARQQKDDSQRLVAQAKRPRGKDGLAVVMQQAGMGSHFRRALALIEERIKAEGVDQHDYKRRIDIGREVGRQIADEYRSSVADDEPARNATLDDYRGTGEEAF